MLDLLGGWPGVISCSIGILGILSSVIIAWAAWKRRKPRYVVRNNVLVEGARDRFSRLAVRYEGIREKQDNVSVAKVAFWNAGRKIIRAEDIASADPLVIQAAEGCTILEARLIQYDPVTRFEAILDKEKNCVRLVFEHLERNQGGVVQVLHTGLRSTDLEVCGTVKESGKPARKLEFPILFLVYRTKGKISRKRYRWFMRFFFLFALTFLFFLTIVNILDATGVTTAWKYELSPEAQAEVLMARPPWVLWISWGYLGFAWLSFLLVVGSMRSPIPTTLSKFEEDW